MAIVYIENSNEFELKLIEFTRQCKKEGIIKNCLSKSCFISKNELARFKRLEHKKQSKK